MVTDDSRPADSGSSAFRRQRTKAATKKHCSTRRQACFDHGFEGNPVQANCDRADIRKGTFFNCFQGKEHLLLLKCHDDWKGAMLHQVRATPFPSARSAVLRSFLYRVDMVAGKPVMCRASV